MLVALVVLARLVLDYAVSAAATVMLMPMLLLLLLLLPLMMLLQLCAPCGLKAESPKLGPAAPNSRRQSRVGRACCSRQYSGITRTPLQRQPQPQLKPPAPALVLV